MIYKEILEFLHKLKEIIFDHFIGVSLIFLGVYLLKKIIIYIFNNIKLEFTIKFDIIKWISFISKEHSIAFRFNNTKSYNFKDIFSDKEIKGSNLIRNLKITLNPDYDSFVKNKNNGQLNFHGCQDVEYVVRIYPKERNLEVIFKSNSLEQIKQAHIQYRYNLGFSQETNSQIINNELSKKINVEDILIDYIRNHDKNILERNINYILEPIVQPW